MTAPALRLPMPGEKVVTIVQSTTGPVEMPVMAMGRHLVITRPMHRGRPGAPEWVVSSRVLGVSLGYFATAATALHFAAEADGLCDWGSLDQINAANVQGRLSRDVAILLDECGGKKFCSCGCRLPVAVA